jgi:alpha-glucuronidase
MTGKILRTATGQATEPAITLNPTDPTLPPDAFRLRTTAGNILITASTDRGVLYGAFALLEKIALAEPIANLNETHQPAVPVRWVNHWDNLEGTIERGYGGRSIFWDNLKSRPDLTRVTDYARMLASLGINGASINNVNVNPRILATDFLPEIARIADAMRPWGVHVAISVDFGSPQKVGGLDTFDPLDPRVSAWWKNKTDEVYRAVPDLAGFIIKADSEGRVGPSAY